MTASSEIPSFSPAPGAACGCGPKQPGDAGAPFSNEATAEPIQRSLLNVELLVIDRSTCQRCAPTGDRLAAAVALLTPVASALGIELRHREIVVQTPAEAREHALLSSPTIRLNGRDIAPDIRESRCESCGDLTASNTSIDCREWHYRGKVYPAAPLPLLVEAVLDAMRSIDERPPVTPAPLEELPENLARYFDDKRQSPHPACCS